MSGTARRRSLIAILDQGVSSATNLAVSILAARALTTEDFGHFGLALAAFSILVGLCRAFSTDPLLVRWTARDDEEIRHGARGATGAALSFGIVVGAVLVLAALVGHEVVPGTVLALGVVLPALMLQDSLRYVSFARRRPAGALLTDGIWLLVTIAPLLVLTSLDTPVPFVVIWGIGAALAAVVAIVQQRVLPSPSVPSWLRHHADVSWSMALEFLLLGASWHLVVVITGLADADDAAALRGAGILLGPASLALNGLLAIAVPEGTRLWQREPRSMRWFAVGGAVSAATLMIVTGLVASQLPDSVGQALLGDSWQPARSVVTTVGVVFGGLAAMYALGAVLRSIGLPQRAVPVAIVTACAVLVATLLTMHSGAEAVTRALAGAVWFGAVLYAFVCWRALRDAIAGRGGPGASAIDATAPRLPWPHVSDPAS